MCGGIVAQWNNSASGLALDSMLHVLGCIGEVLVEEW